MPDGEAFLLRSSLISSCDSWSISTHSAFLSASSFNYIGTEFGICRSNGRSLQNGVRAYGGATRYLRCELSLGLFGSLQVDPQLFFLQSELNSKSDNVGEWLTF